MTQTEAKSARLNEVGLERNKRSKKIEKRKHKYVRKAKSEQERRNEKKRKNSSEKTSV